jgi:hypothetical protein
MDELNDTRFGSGLGGSAAPAVERDEIDALIDRALSNYTAGEPRTGFAARVVHSAAGAASAAVAASRHQPSTARAWAIAASGWAVAAASVLLWLRALPVEIVIGPHPSNAEIAQNAQPVGRPSSASVAARVAPLPPPPVRAAVRAHTQRPGQTAEMQSVAFNPIVIAPIRIGAMQ